MPAWMAGAWTAQLEDSTWEEHWMKPVDGTMQGMGREVKDGKIAFMEFMSLEPNKEGGMTLHMILGNPSSGDKKPNPFPMTEITDTKIVFDRGGDDFPQVISYEKKGDDEIFCQIKGGSMAIDFNFKRMKGS